MILPAYLVLTLMPGAALGDHISCYVGYGCYLVHGLLMTI